MKYAILSDVHANWSAWNALRDRAWALNADLLICLGDMVGYGPSPARVLQDIREHVSLFVMGNHEAALAGQVPLDSFTPTARRSVVWTRRRLDREALQFFRELPLVLQIEDMSLVHAESPDPAAFGYVDDTEDAAACFRASEARVIFIGHTHVPAIYILTPKGTVMQYEGDRVQIAADYRYLVNVGSGGDPRDGSTDACFATYDVDRGVIELHRVAIPLDAFRREWAAAAPPMSPPYFVRIASVGPGAKGGREHEHALVVPKTSKLQARTFAPAPPVRLTAADLVRLKAAPAALASLVGRSSGLRAKSRMWGWRVLASLAVVVVLALGTLGLLRARRSAPTPFPEPIRTSPVQDAEPSAAPVIPMEDLVRAAQRGELILLAERAELNGKTFRLACMMSRTNIGYWWEPSDVAVWRFRLPESRRFDVQIEYALAPAGEGNQVYVGIGREKLIVPLPSTGGWSNYVRKTLGQLRAQAGLNVLEVRPAAKPKGGLMNLREIRLIPYQNEPRDATPESSQS